MEHVKVLFSSRFVKISTLVCLIISLPCSSYAQEINPNDPYSYNTREEIDYKQVEKETINYYINELRSLTEEKKAITDDDLFSFASNIMRKSYFGTKEFEKFLKKRKISDVSIIDDKFKLDYCVYEHQSSIHRENGKYSPYYDCRIARDGMKKLFANGNAPKRIDSTKIKNINYRGWYYCPQSPSLDADRTLDEIDAKLQSKGWEWTYKKTGTRHEDSYPTHLVYFTIDGHPEYRFNTDNALVNDMYDKEGNLVRVSRLSRNTEIRDNQVVHPMYKTVEGRVKRFYYKKDFINNKYDINSADNETLKSLKYQLEIDDDISDGINKQGEAVKKAKDQYETAATKEGKRQAAQNLSKEWNKLNDAVNFNTTKSSDYLSQLKKDHENELAFIYAIDRIDNTSFKVTILDKNGNCTHTVKFTFVNDGPYNMKAIISELPTESLFVQPCQKPDVN